MNEKTETLSLDVHWLDHDFAIDAIDESLWKQFPAVPIETYWSGWTAPPERRFSVRLAWSDTAINVQFEAVQTEPLVVNSKPDISKKTIGLWDRDVCEIFIAPDASEPNIYFEFEIAPTGEWIDLGIAVTPAGRVTDRDYISNMTSAVRIGESKIVMAIKIPWDALGRTPKVGDRWRGNLYRCVGRDPTRGYLAWSPTRTKTPNFHVPEAFGEFRFVN